MTWRLSIVERDGTHVAGLDLIGGTMTLGTRLAATIGPRGVELLRGRFVTVSRDDSPAELFVPVDPLDRDLDSAVETYSLTALAATHLVARVHLRRGITIARGAFVRESVLSLIRDSLPWLPVTIGDNDGSLREPLAYAAGTSLADPVDGLLAAGGMTELAAASGELGLVSEPWVAPSQRGVAATFGPADQPDMSPFLPQMSVSEPVEPAVNEWLAITRGTPVLVGRWADEAAIARDGLISRTAPGVMDATNQAAADRLAAQARDDARPRRRMRLAARYEPRARPGAVVGVEWPRWGVTGRWEVSAAPVVQLTPASDATYDLMEV